MGRVVSTKACNSFSTALVLTVDTKSRTMYGMVLPFKWSFSSLIRTAVCVETCVGTSTSAPRHHPTPHPPPPKARCLLNAQSSVAFRWAVVLKGDLRLWKGWSSDFAAQQFVSRAYTSCRGELCPHHAEPLQKKVLNSIGVTMAVFLWAMSEEKDLESDNEVFWRFYSTSG